MKHILRGALLLALLLSGGAALAQAGGDYDLSFSTIDGGGGTSSGGDYVLSGTVGQPDAGALSGGSYALTGGFWGSAAPQYAILLPMTIAH